MSGQPFNTGANTWDKRAVIPPCRACACRSPRSAALWSLWSCGSGGFVPGSNCQFSIDFEAYHVGSMLDHFPILIPLYHHLRSTFPCHVPKLFSNQIYILDHFGLYINPIRSHSIEERNCSVTCHTKLIMLIY